MNNDIEYRMFRNAAILFAVIIALTICRYCNSDELPRYDRNNVAAVYAWIDNFFVGSSPRKLERAKQLARIVQEVAAEQDINFAIPVIIISYESTWDANARGKKGEIGLMQVNNLRVPPSPREQITQGIQLFRLSFEKCGTLLGALGYYATGRSCAPYRGSRFRHSKILSLIAR